MFIKTDGEEAINSLFIESLYIVKVADVPQDDIDSASRFLEPNREA